MNTKKRLLEALELLRDYIRVYPNNSGRAIRFVEEVEKELGVKVNERG